MNVTVVAFSGGTREPSRLAFTVLQYFTFFPVVTPLSVGLEYLVERSGAKLRDRRAPLIVVAHLWLRKRHRDGVRLHCGQIELEEDEDEFPMRLGLKVLKSRD